jgi:hypothetical protein
VRVIVRWVAYRFSFPRAQIRKKREGERHMTDRSRNLRDAFLTLFGVISVVNGAFGNGRLLIAVVGAIALAFVAWQRWPRRAASL